MTAVLGSDAMRNWKVIFGWNDGDEKKRPLIRNSACQGRNVEQGKFEIKEVAS